MLPSTLTIRNVGIRPAAVLAPMAGVTDTVFRRVIRDHEFEPRAHAKDGVLRIEVPDVEKALATFRSGEGSATGSSGWEGSASLPFEGTGER